MTRDEFCSMERGDIVSAVGNGTCLIGGTYQEDGLTKVYFRALPIDCIIVGITEEDCGEPNWHHGSKNGYMESRFWGEVFARI